MRIGAWLLPPKSLTVCSARRILPVADSRRGRQGRDERCRWERAEGRCRQPTAGAGRLLLGFIADARWSSAGCAWHRNAPLRRQLAPGAASPAPPLAASCGALSPVLSSPAGDGGGARSQSRGERGQGVPLPGARSSGHNRSGAAASTEEPPPLSSASPRKGRLVFLPGCGGRSGGQQSVSASRCRFTRGSPREREVSAEREHPALRPAPLPALARGRRGCRGRDPACSRGTEPGRVPLPSRSRWQVPEPVRREDSGGAGLGERCGSAGSRCRMRRPRDAIAGPCGAAEGGTEPRTAPFRCYQ